jgi:YggT family protein
MIGVYIILATRILVFAVFSVALVVALTHWAVKHGHLTPFGPLPRTVRRLGAPLLRTFERRLHRSGGNPADAPYTLFWVALLGGLGLIFVVQWLVGLLYSMAYSASAGPGALLRFVVNLAFSILMIAILIRAVASWFGVSPYSKPMRLVYGLTDWLIEPLRKVIPPIGMIDITPMVAYFILYLARSVLMGMF